MEDATNIESLQADLTRQHTEAVRTQALQHVLQVFAPALLTSPVDYRTLLDRVRTVLDEAVASATMPDPVPPTPPSTEPLQGEAHDV